MRNELELVMDVKEIRYINLMYLIGQCKTTNEFADKASTSPTYISQITSKTIDKKTNLLKSVGDKLARKIEKGFDLENGWMDNLHYNNKIDLTNLDDDKLLHVAVRKVINQLIASGVYEAKQNMDISVITSFIVSEFKSLVEERTKEISENGNAEAQ